MKCVFIFYFGTHTKKLRITNFVFFIFLLFLSSLPAVGLVVVLVSTVADLSGRETTHYTLLSTELSDLKLNTHFSASEIKEWYKAFMMDFPGGKLNRAQFKMLYSNLFPYGDESRFVEHAFRSFDSDGDGYVDFRELMLAMSISSTGDPSQKLEWAFSMYDLDGDGYVTRREMFEMITSVQRMARNNKEAIETEHCTEQRVHRIFLQMDRNNDGNLSKEEFEAAQAQRKVELEAKAKARAKENAKKRAAQRKEDAKKDAAKANADAEAKAKAEAEKAAKAKQKGTGNKSGHAPADSEGKGSA